MNVYLIVILLIITADCGLNLAKEILNRRHLRTAVPEEFAGFYDAEKYQKSQQYLREDSGLAIAATGFLTVVTVAFLLLGGFNLVDGIARRPGFGTIPAGLIFAGILLLAADLLSLPFAVRHTFGIEAKYGFNRTTARTFVLDTLKKWFLAAVIGGIAFAGVIFFFDRALRWAWLWCWAAVTVFQLFIVFLAPVAILPLFNRFVPLEDGGLKKAIEDYCRSQDFDLRGVFKMDGSRRSTRANAFFTGFGKNRRIALFDTLIEKHSPDELVTIVAHEVGHYRRKHVLKMIFFSILTGGLMFYLLSFFINNEGLFRAFRMERLSVYASLFFFGFLYQPLARLVSIAANALSRRHEFEADAFAAATSGKGGDFVTALKKLSADQLLDLFPHPLKVWLDDAHPPVLERIRALQESSSLSRN